MIAKGPKYRFPAKKDLQRCREKIAASLNDIVIVGVSESMSLIGVNNVPLSNCTFFLCEYIATFYFIYELIL